MGIRGGAKQIYWAIEGKLMAGFYPGAQDPREARAKIEHLLRFGIRCFVDLTEEDEVASYGSLKAYAPVLKACEEALGLTLGYRRHPILDLWVPRRPEMVEILNTLDVALQSGSPAYVHCLGGRGRTGTVVGCYFVRHAGEYLGTSDPDLAPERALQKVVALRKAQRVHLPHDSPQMPVQFDLVRSWNIGE